MLALAFLDDAVLERPALLARELKIQVGGIDGRAEHQSERLLDPADIEPCGRKDALARVAQRVKVNGGAGG